MLYVRNLEYEEKPSYEMIRGKFRKVLNEMHHNRKEEVPLDWKVLRDKQRETKRQDRVTKSGLNYQVEGQAFVSDLSKQTGNQPLSSAKKEDQLQQNHQLQFKSNKQTDGKIQQTLQVPGVPKQPSLVAENNEIIRKITINYQISIKSGKLELGKDGEKLKEVKSLYKQLIEQGLQGQVCDIERRKQEFMIEFTKQLAVNLQRQKDE